nr:hypothetical protein [Tanacetum cinerariifolium]
MKRTLKDDPAYYPVDRGNNDDDENNDDVEKDEEDKEEEEHLVLADPSDVSTDDLVPRAHAAWPINKKAYAGSLPLCDQCKFPHNGTCTAKCRNYKKVGHIIQNFRTPATTKNERTRTCYECGSLRHYKRKANIVANALSRKEQEPPLKVRALVMTIGLDLPRKEQEPPLRV